jgi:hypothetical protein
MPEGMPRYESGLSPRAVNPSFAPNLALETGGSLGYLPHETGHLRLERMTSMFNVTNSAVAYGSRNAETQAPADRNRWRIRYTLRIVHKIAAVLLFTLLAVHAGFAEETSFRRIQVPGRKGRQNKAVLTFNDANKAIEVRPVRADRATPISIPYGQIDKCTYEFTKKHRVSEGTIVTAPLGIGAILMLTRAKSHWLEIDYHVEDQPHAYVLRMDKHDYIHILEAVKKHVGIDVEVLGNANKR